MANVTYKLRVPKSNTPQIIYLIYRFGRNDKFVYPTGFKIRPIYWDKKRMRVRNLTEALGKDTINNRLNELQTILELYIIEQTAKGKNISKELLRNHLNNYTNNSGDEERCLHGFIKAFLKRNKTRINPKTGKIISYKVMREHERTYELLKEFEEKKNKNIKLNFDDITLDFYADFTTYLQTLNLSVNTIGHKIQTLKMWLNEATERGINTTQQYKSQRFRAVTEETENIYLSAVELEKLYNHDFSNNPRLDRVRDLFLVGAWTGLRFSDFTSIASENIHNNKLHIEQQKTGKPVSIPLHPIVVNIWNKYGKQLPPIISNQKFNEYIKDVCKLAEINNIEQKGITKGGIRVKESFEKWKLVSSHTARRSFATNLYLSGFPTLSIMQITGHKTESAFMKYIKVTHEQHAELLNKHWIEKGEHIRIAK